MGASCHSCSQADVAESQTNAYDEIQKIDGDVLQPQFKHEGLLTSEDFDLSPEALSDSENEGPLKPGCKVKLVGMKSADHLNDHIATLQSYDASKRRWTVWIEAKSKQVSVKTENLIIYDDEEDAEDMAFSECPEAGENTERSAPDDSGQTPERSANAGDNGGFEVGQTVRIQRMQKAKHLNGFTGELLSFDGERGRWTVLVHCDLTNVAVQSKNLEFVSASVPAAAETPSYAAEEPPSPGRFVPGAYAKIIDMKKAKHLNGEVGCLQSYDASSGRWTLVLDKGSVQVAAKTMNLTPCAKPSDESKSKKQTKRRGKKNHVEEDSGGTGSNSRQDAYEKLGSTLQDSGCPQQ